MQSNKIKNNIITLSGQPVAGKSVAVKALIEKLKEQGYKEENIHLESTGSEFRKYFNLVTDFIKNIDNEDKLQELSKKEELKSIFQNETYRNAFQKTMVKFKKEKVDFSKFTIAQANNMPELGDIRRIIDTVIDEDMKKKGKEINKTERPDEIWIIDSRLAFSNIPDSFSVRLTADAKVAGKRLFNDKTRGAEDSKYKSLEEAERDREERRIGENKRYKERYGIDLEDKDNYNLIIDTSYSTIDDIADTILSCLDREKQGLYYGKTWSSPKRFLPLQKIDQTDVGMKEIIDSIKENGYYPSEEIEILESDNLLGIIEGHHRNFAMASLNKTLVPYTVVSKDDEYIYNSSNSARQRIDSMNLSSLFDHEEYFRKHEKDFSYESIYPKLYEKVKNKDNEAR